VFAGDQKKGAVSAMMNMNRILAKLSLALCVLCLGLLRGSAQTAVTPAGSGTSGASGSQYAVQVSTNLIDWTALQTNYSPFVFTDTNSRSYTRRFYRTVYLP
jgi:hypothetical protein